MSADERKDEGAGEQPPVETPEEEARSVTWPMWGKYDPAPPHVLKAVSLYLKGTDNFAEIARVLGADPVLDRKKARRDVFRYLATTRDEPDVERERRSAVAKWRLQEQEVWAEYGRQEGNGNCRVGLLKQAGELAEKIAAAEGVVTRREGREHSTPPGDPLLEVLKRFAPNEIAEELGNGRFGGGSAADPGGGAGRDLAPGGGEAATAEGGA